MSDSPFSQPAAGGDKFEPANHNGRLLLLYPKAYNPNEPTKFGDSQSADVDIVVVDQADPQTGQPIVLHNARVFGNLARSVRDDLGGVVLGRLGQGANTKGNPPWILVGHTDADAAMSVPIHQAFQAGQFRQPDASPAAAAAPPAHDPWAGMQTSVAPPQTPAYAAPAAAAAAPTGVATPSAPDPNVAKLINNGMDPAKVAGMDPQTRALLAASYA